MLCPLNILKTIAQGILFTRQGYERVALDSYAEAVDWTMTAELPLGDGAGGGGSDGATRRVTATNVAAGDQPHAFVVEVLGKKDPASLNDYVQIVGVAVFN